MFRLFQKEKNRRIVLFYFLRVEETVVGGLGRQEITDGIEFLQKIPYLENVYDNTCWNKIFEPSLGDLKSFIQEHWPTGR